MFGVSAPRGAFTTGCACLRSCFSSFHICFACRHQKFYMLSCRRDRLHLWGSPCLVGYPSSTIGEVNVRTRGWPLSASSAAAERRAGVLSLTASDLQWSTPILRSVAVSRLPVLCDPLVNGGSSFNPPPYSAFLCILSCANSSFPHGFLLPCALQGKPNLTM